MKFDLHVITCPEREDNLTIFQDIAGSLNKKLIKHGNEQFQQSFEVYACDIAADKNLYCFIAFDKNGIPNAFFYEKYLNIESLIKTHAPEFLSQV